MVAITTIPMMDKLREIFEMPNDIGIILLRLGVIPNNPQIFASLRLSYPPLVREFLYIAGASLG